MQTLSVVQAEQLQTAEYTAETTCLEQGEIDLQTLSVVQAEQLQTPKYTAQATCVAQGGSRFANPLSCSSRTASDR